MKYLMIALLLFMIGCEYQQEEVQPPQIRQGTEQVVLVIGDSRAEHGGTWDTLPQTVHNVGKSGSTTKYIIDHAIPYAEFLDRIDTVIIFTGINDQRELSPDIFKKNLEFIIAYFHERNIHIVLMDISCNPAIDDSIYDVNRAIMEESVEYRSVEYSENHFIDSVHFSDDGYLFVSSIIENCIL